jgi:hypothetical protein
MYLEAIVDGIDEHQFDLNTFTVIDDTVHSKYVYSWFVSTNLRKQEEVRLKQEIAGMISCIERMGRDTLRKYNKDISRYLEGPPRHGGKEWFNIDSGYWVKKSKAFGTKDPDSDLIINGNTVGDMEYMMLIYKIASGIHDYELELLTESEQHVGASSSEPIVISDDDAYDVDEEYIDPRSSSMSDIRKLIYVRSLGFDIDSRRSIMIPSHLSEIDSRCFCCDSLVSFESMQAGHIVSDKWGGLKKVSNLEVVCQPCNLAMGTRHMYEYMKTRNTPGYLVNRDKIDLKEKQINAIIALDNLTAALAELDPLERQLNRSENPFIRLHIISEILRDELIEK